MSTYLVTGGAGFIGSNFVLYMLRKHDDCKPFLIGYYMLISDGTWCGHVYF